MQVYVLLVILYEVQAHYDPDSDSPNVGTVLFKHSDTNCKRWTRENIDLLQARKYFQKIIPSPHLIDTINEDYIANLLKYFQNSYSTVKREIKNPATHNMMNIALSDALGGYLKLWVLPITKYAFYGGTVSLDKAVSIFQVYEDIKTKLNTDGHGWRTPNENLLNSVAINIASPPCASFTRSMKDPCKQLSFYEETDSGLTIPLPVINWSMSPMMLFVPLKNKSFVSLTSPNSSKTLLKYYDIAKNCMQSQSSDSLDNFNQRFQTWLVTDIAPHLNDEKLYIAFGSILTLMNKTKNFCGKMSDAFDEKYSKIRCQAVSLGLPSHWTSKKYLILFIILLIEIIWCIPTLICVIRSRKKRRNRGLKNFFGKFLKRKTMYKVDNFSELHEEIKEDNEKHDKGSRGVKLFLKPRARNLEVDVQFPPYDCMMPKSSSSQSRNKTTSSEQITLVNETPLKKILPEFDSALVANQKKELSNIKISKTADVRKTNEIKTRISNEIVESTKTLTLIKDSERTIKHFLYSEHSITPKPSIIKSKSLCKCCLASGSEKGNNEAGCSCAPCINNDNNKRKQETKKVTYIEPPTRFGRFKRKEKTQCKTIMRTMVDTKSQIQKHTILENSNIKINSSKNTKITTEHPLLRIKIERPKAEIKVGISSFRKCSENIKKPSKIPRLTMKDTRTEIIKEEIVAGPTTDVECSRNNNTVMCSNRNIQKKCQTLDDSAIKRSPIDTKLNITL